MKTAKNHTAYQQAGWWIPGSLKPGWDANFQANFDDLATKMNQLGLVPIVEGLLPNPSTGFYFSMAEFDYIQLLSVEPPQGRQSGNQVPNALASHTIVAYSVWMSAQAWSSFSPIPILQLKETDEELGTVQQYPEQTYFPVGWYLLGNFAQSWYNDVEKNYQTAVDKRRELHLNCLSPFYECQSSFYGCLQMVQPAYHEGVPDVSSIQTYVDWFNGTGFGSIKAIPFMSQSLLKEAILIAGKTP